jgi:cytochrome P450
MSSPSEHQCTSDIADAYLADPANRAMPYGKYEVLRENASVLQTSSGTWLVTCYADASRAP